MDLELLGSIVLVVILFSVFPLVGYILSIAFVRIIERELDKNPNDISYNGATYVKENDREEE